MTSASSLKEGAQRSSIIIALLLSLGLLVFGESVFITLVFSGFLFVLLDPAVEWLHTRHLPRRFGSPLVLLFAVCLIGLVVFSFYDAILKLMGQLATYEEKITSVVSRLHVFLQHLLNRTHEILQGTGGQNPNNAAQSSNLAISPESTTAVNGFILKGFNSIMNLLTFVIFIPLLTLFMLLERDSLHARLLGIFRSRGTFERTLSELKQMTRGFFIGNFVVGSFMSLIFAGVFILIHLRNPFPMALFAGFLNLIPVLGTFLGALLPCFQAFLQFDTLSPVLIIALSTLGIHFIGNNIVMPKFVGAKVNINATSATLGFLVFGSLWGGIGLFLSTPLIASLRIILATRERTRPIANLLGKNLIAPPRRIYSVSSPHRPHTNEHAQIKGKQ